MFDTLDQTAVNALRMLSVDQINAANSGHPGLPLGAAPMAYALWSRFMVQNPENSHWMNRDRFVLSAGHGSALLYSLLHLSGYDVTIDDLKQFRQIGSKTPGHPEVHHTDGVEATTGPLGQGVATAVGMAMAEAHLAARFNRDGHTIVDHYTYALCGDGDLMEGVASEACSLAGKLGLGKLIVLYDSNDICLDGPTDQTFTEHVGLRFKAYGWQVLYVADGNDLGAVESAIAAAKENTETPTLIEIKTVIGYGSPLAGTNKVHGAPIGAEGTEKLRETLHWEHAPFEVPAEVYDRFHETVASRGARAESEWNAAFERYRAAYPAEAKALTEEYEGVLPEGWQNQLPRYAAGDAAAASRKTSESAIQAIAATLPNFWGGSADLSSSNNTMIKGEDAFSPENYTGRNIWYGVREFAMAAIMNGIALHGGTKTYGGTFFVFSDYLKGAVRVAALSKLPVTYVFTHDSIAVGEDGPTHEPIEHLAAWRALPGLDVLRPADGNEVSEAWRLAVESDDHPTMLVLTRQNLPVLEGTDTLAREGVSRGGYVLSPAKGTQHGLLIATGSEVALALKVQSALEKEGVSVSVVSMPSMYRFDRQEEAYREAVLPISVRNRMSIEMASTYGWGKYVGLDGVSIGIDRFGMSGPGDAVIKEFGFDANEIAQRYLEAFGRNH